MDFAIFGIFNILIFVKLSCSLRSVTYSDRNGPGYASSYTISVVTPSLGTLLEGPQWSMQENALYFVDVFGPKIFRLADTGELTNRTIAYGSTSLVVPVKNSPGIILVSMRTGLYLLRWGAPGGDTALRQITNVDLGKPDNLLNDGKVDRTGRIWFGTLGKLMNGFRVTPDQATLYSMTYKNVEHPEIKIRPVTLSNGIAFSSNNKKMFYNDSPTKQIVAYDFVLETGEIANKTVLFDLTKHNISGLPDGMTIDVDDNLWVAAFAAAKVLKINSRNGDLMDVIKLPVDQVSSVMWGGRDLSTLYVTTGKKNINNPKPSSGSLFAITNTGTRGLPEPAFIYPNAATIV